MKPASDSEKHQHGKDPSGFVEGLKSHGWPAFSGRAETMVKPSLRGSVFGALTRKIFRPQDAVPGAGASPNL